MAQDARTPIYLVYDPIKKSVIRTAHLVIDKDWTPMVDDTQELHLHNSLSLDTDANPEMRNTISHYGYLRGCIVLHSASNKYYEVNSIVRQSLQLEIFCGNCIEIPYHAIHMPREERYKHKVTEHQVSFTTQQLDRMREDYLNTKAMEISRQEAAALRLQPNSTEAHKILCKLFEQNEAQTSEKSDNQISEVTND